MKNKFAKNISLMMLNNFSWRINFFPILWIYYLTLNNTFANHVWIYMWIWYLAWFLLEIPSWYLSDLLWHKKIIIAGKLSFLLSILCFIWASFIEYPLILFILAMIFQMWWKAFTSWSDRAILYDSLVKLDIEKEFTKIQSKLSATSSLLSTIVILWLPFFTKISILFPFYIIILQYLFWLIVSLLLVDTENHKNINRNNKKKIREVILENKWFWLFPYLLFGYLLQSFMFADGVFRPLYMEELWLPVIYMWTAMWISRFLWYIFYPLASKLENKFKLKNIYIWELFFAVAYYFIVAYLNNPYLVAVFFWASIWFFRSLIEIPNHFILKHIKDENYKATMLSVASQIGLFSKIILSFVWWYVMSISYKLWFFSFWVILAIVMWINYMFILKSDIEK